MAWVNANHPADAGWFAFARRAYGLALRQAMTDLTTLASSSPISVRA
ncbi:hypothetical protein SAMN05444166_5587 [Singulisphaera sp. GP187]|nr:hypothetical protein SAMN05444166_5587 [Singulisphaera sp. GP187]